MALWIVISLAVAVLAPLTAFFVGGRRFWATVGERAPDGLLERHGLEAGDTLAVQRAMARGRRAEEPRIRPAVVEWAGSTLAAVEESERLHARRRAVAAALTALGAVALVLAVVLGLTDGGAGGGFWLVVVLSLGLLLNLVVLPRVLRRNLRRAVSSNA
ncbi:hypothetical protein [Trujillonella endophytica]|uniref:Uncharacterized protein n=1 Tax=Trujillonella endophytica TaxID=673521 RepID=A0A1H8T1J9_9ACTN|nr:hypothetical protein [Trujillella endophytica]SEO84782.1 hypothetical protein SAMN05660991_01998 [Trujillella endophytica]